MGEVMSFLGGIMALALLGFLLFFELSRDSMLFASVISALILLVLGAMLVGLRGAIGGIIRALAGRVRPKGEIPEIPKGGKSKRMDMPRTSGLPRRVSNPMLKDLMERIREGKMGMPKGGPPEMEQPKLEKGRQSGPSGLVGRLGRIAVKLKTRGSGKPGARAEELEEIREKLAGMDGLEEAVEGPELEEVEGALEEETEGRRPSRKRRAAGKPRGGPETRGPPGAPAEEVEPPKGETPMEGAGCCQICGGRGNLQMHHIAPPEKGGSGGGDNIIMLCGRHKKQAEEGMYSENLLRRLKGI